MRVAALRLALAGSLCLSACGQQDGAGNKTAVAPPTKETTTEEAELAKKLAEAEATFNRMTPAEKKKLADQQKRIANTLPMPLASAGSIKLQPAGKPATTLATVAPVGAPTIIAAWASWCIPCKLEARELAGLRRRYGPDRLTIAYLNIGDPKVEAVKGPAFLREAGAEQLGLTMLASDDFLKLTRVDQLSVPRVLVYDRAGKPTTVISGAIVGKSDARLVRAIEKVIG